MFILKLKIYFKIKDMKIDVFCKIILIISLMLDKLLSLLALKKYVKFFLIDNFIKPNGPNLSKKVLHIFLYVTFFNRNNIILLNEKHLYLKVNQIM